MEQRTSQWYQARVGKITASRFADVMAGSTTQRYRNYVSSLALERLTGVRANSFQNDAMLHGIKYESHAIRWYQSQLGVRVQEASFELHKEYDFIGASPDGYIQTSGLIEVKCPQIGNHLKTVQSNRLPSQYKWQLQGQMMVTNRMWVDFVSFHPELGGHVIKVHRDSQAIDRLLFWCIQANKDVEKIVERNKDRKISIQSRPMIRPEIESNLNRNSNSAIQQNMISRIAAYFKKIF